MKKDTAAHHRPIPAKTTFILLMQAAMLCLLPATSGGADAPPDLSAPMTVRTEFIRQLSPPGGGDGFLRPSAVRCDPATGEVLVADPGHNRILIFDRNGTFRFSFSGGDRFSTPIDLAVDSQGYILALATIDSQRRLLRLDFDGLFVGVVPLRYEIDGEPLDFSSVSIASGDRIVLGERSRREIHVYDRDGGAVSRFPVLRDLDPEAMRRLGIGDISVRDDLVYAPLPTLGTVRVYALDGSHLRSIGRKGDGAGELAFPTAVASTADGLVAVLDKNRFMVVCYGPDGRFVGEFGGKGVSPGWFFFPGLLCLDDRDRVYVGQIFKNRIQVCALPEAFRRRAGLEGSGADPQEG